MGTEQLWQEALQAARAAGWRARVVAVRRLETARRRAGAALVAAGLPAATADHVAAEVAFALPSSVTRPRSVVVGAVARPLTKAGLMRRGARHIVPVPPHYAGYCTAPEGLVAALRPVLRAAGHQVEGFAPPLKTLAAGAGLARYGRNAIAYVPGLGSYLLLAACVSDVEPPADDEWGEAQPLESCDGCAACAAACPGGAIRGDGFSLRTHRCLTLVNEDRAPFPDWVRPEWHHCAVGCLRCQVACPENAGVTLTVEPPELFDETETAAILAAVDSSWLPAATRAKLARCGLDYSPDLIARNLAALIGA